MTEIVFQEKDIESVANKLLPLAGANKIYTLTGDLGSGKTRLTQAICKVLGVQEKVTSPTFSLVNEYHYEGTNGELCKFYHLDLYRLKTIEEALDLGIEEYLYDANYCIIEWPAMIETLLPEDTVKININILKDYSRKILIL